MSVILNTLGTRYLSSILGRSTAEDVRYDGPTGYIGIGGISTVSMSLYLCGSKVHYRQ
ncbi:uncharacterized protein M421DRAFT_415782 [Didymella exigua CBS 183.55]|uniref:Uncharacterized protein n=1 Tax=Didymella exigua CBS 183.55 TaxID=1150837 RepID=A0A6A5S2A3_9PLEO|nr:uncharacterized protein M421DRAFT_415782 [Didymella exigua CBS 183.55]KAF1933438.1 hypothetical protein M421DRAFT_415782 [Didymella exigua CBS 183.55]